jgi:hypothetical protein
MEARPRGIRWPAFGRRLRQAGRYRIRTRDARRAGAHRILHLLRARRCGGWVLVLCFCPNIALLQFRATCTEPRRRLRVLCGRCAWLESKTEGVLRWRCFPGDAVVPTSCERFDPVRQEALGTVRFERYSLTRL